MTYLDPMRISLSGDVARAQPHVRTARAVAFALVKQNLEGGATSGRRRVALPDGVVIEVTQAGQQVSAHIHAAPLAGGDEITMAYVSITTGTPRMLIVDMDAEKVVQNITGLGSILSICAHPKQARYLFVLNTARQVIKIDLQEFTAVGITFETTIPLVDMFIAPDGEHLHARYWATGNPLGGGFYGGVVNIATEDLAVVNFAPDQLWSNRTYRGAAHPQRLEQLYLPVFGDGDLDGQPETGHESDPNYVVEAVEVYDYTSDTPLYGDTAYEAKFDSSFGLNELVIDPAGERAYLCSNRADALNDLLEVTPLPTLIAYDVSAGLSRHSDHFLGKELTGCVGTSRDGSKIFVMERATDQALVLEKDDDGNYAEGAPFQCRADDTEVAVAAYNRGIKHGPRGATEDNRMFFLSAGSKTLWAFKPNTTTPDKQVTFVDTPNTFALNRARRLIPQVQP